jgi:hypothetical protein
MALSNQTVNKLAIALTPEVINSIYADERWIDFMCEVIPEIVSEKLGSEDIDLVTEIGTCIMDNILLKPSTV